MHDRLMTVSRKSTSSGMSVARSAVERADGRDISETAERCTRVLGGSGGTRRGEGRGHESVC